MDNLRRIKSRPISLLLINSDAIGIYQEWDGGTTNYPVSMAPVSRGRIAGETTYSEFLLRPLQKTESLKDKFLIVLVDEPPWEQFLQCRAIFKNRLQTANHSFVTSKTAPEHGKILIYYSPEQSVEQMLALQSESGSKIRFFVMEGKETGSGR